MAFGITCVPKQDKNLRDVIRDFELTAWLGFMNSIYCDQLYKHVTSVH